MNEETQVENLPPAATGQMITELRDRAADFGFVLAGRCKHCMRPIWGSRSLKDRVGPVCRQRHGNES